MAISIPGHKLMTHPIWKHFINTHILFILIFYLSIVLYLTIKAFFLHSILIILAFIGIGIFLWTPLEYVMHRFVFHGDMINHYKFKQFQYFMHGYHHECPTDATRLVLPIIITFPLTCLFYFIYIKIFGNLGQLVFVGFVLGYLFYDFTHYTVHRFRPKTPLGKFLKQYHFCHHFKDKQNRFGVTNPIWDNVLKTNEVLPRIGIK